MKNSELHMLLNPAVKAYSTIMGYFSTPPAIKYLQRFIKDLPSNDGEVAPEMLLELYTGLTNLAGADIPTLAGALGVLRSVTTASATSSGVSVAAPVASAAAAESISTAGEKALSTAGDSALVGKEIENRKFLEEHPEIASFAVHTVLNHLPEGLKNDPSVTLAFIDSRVDLKEKAEAWRRYEDICMYHMSRNPGKGGSMLEEWAKGRNAFINQIIRQIQGELAPRAPAVFFDVAVEKGAVGGAAVGAGISGEMK